MAITIIDQPTTFAKVGQKLIVASTSTNVAEPNFRYVVAVKDELDNTLVSELLIPPNPSNRLMVELSNILKDYVKIEPYNPNSERSYISAQSNVSVETELLNCIKHFTIEVSEGYDVDGVFTIDTESAVDTTEIVVINASYKVKDGYKPDPNLIYSFTSTTSRLLGGRKWYTHKPINFPIGTSIFNEQIIYIPVRKSELDWGTISLIAQDSGQTALTTTNDPVLRMTIYDSSGAPSSTTYGAWVNLDIGFIGVYPANLNAHGELLRPADFPNWRWYDIAMYDSTNTTRKSAIYRFYPVEDDCRHDNVRLAWWHPEYGGWDFFNFSKKNEESLEVDRKRVKKVVGTYAASTFSFQPFDRELAEGMVSQVDYINITTDWLSEGEFELLGSLIASRSVYIVKDDGALIPVLVEESSYTKRTIREAKQYNYSMKLRYSQQFM